jgi:hypothetical protein
LSVLGVAVLASLAIAPIASARRISFTGEGYVYDAEPGEVNHPLVGFGATASDTIFFEPSETLAIDESAALHGCNYFVIEEAIYYDRVVCPTTPSITFNLGDGDDELEGGPANETILAGPGNDAIRGGREGNDLEDGGPGDDRFDESVAGEGSDTFIGGDGRDELTYSGSALDGRISPLTVTLDGIANDGESGEQDNVGGDIESVTGGRGPDTLIGSEDSNELHGGAGDDVLRGLGGSDRLDGGDGNDQIDARDGSPDLVSCGPGFDRATIDAVDSLSPDPLDACEVVDAGNAGPASAGGGEAGAGTRAALAVKAPGRIKLGRLLRAGLPVEVICPGPCEVNSSLYASAGIARRLGLARARTALVGRSRRSLRAAGTVRLHVKLRGKARKRLKRARRIALTLKTTVTQPSGAATKLRTVRVQR